MSDTIKMLLEYADTNGISALIALALLDLILGVSVAIQNGEFKLFYVGAILQKLAPMVIAYVAVSALMDNPALSAAIFAVAAAQLTGSVLKNIGFLFPGIGEKMPNALIQPEWRRMGFGAATEARLERMSRQLENNAEVG